MVWTKCYIRLAHILINHGALELNFSPVWSCHLLVNTPQISVKTDAPSVKALSLRIQAIRLQSCVCLMHEDTMPLCIHFKINTEDLLMYRIHVWNKIWNENNTQAWHTTDISGICCHEFAYLINFLTLPIVLSLLWPGLEFIVKTHSLMHLWEVVIN